MSRSARVTWASKARSRREERFEALATEMDRVRLEGQRDPLSHRVHQTSAISIRRAVARILPERGVHLDGVERDDRELFAVRVRQPFARPGEEREPDAGVGSFVLEQALEDALH